MGVFKKIKELVAPTIVDLNAEELLLWLQSASISPSFFTKIAFETVTFYVGHPLSILPKNYRAKDLHLFFNPEDKICYVGSILNYNGTFFHCVKRQTGEIFYSTIDEDVMLESSVTIVGCKYAIGTVTMDEFESLYKADLLKKEANANAGSSDSLDNLTLSSKYKIV